MRARINPPSIVASTQAWTADLRTADQVQTPDGRLSTMSSWVVEDGRPVAVPA